MVGFVLMVRSISTSQTLCIGLAGWLSAAQCRPRWSSWGGWRGSAELWRQHARPSTATTSPRPPRNQWATHFRLPAHHAIPVCRRCKPLSRSSRYLLVTGLHLQHVLLPDGVEHAALPAEVSEALLLIVPVHLHGRTNTHLPVCAVRATLRSDWCDAKWSSPRWPDAGWTLGDPPWWECTCPAVRGEQSGSHPAVENKTTESNLFVSWQVKTLLTLGG